MSSDTATETRGRKAGLVVYLLVVVGAIVASLVLVAGFWGDEDESVEFTPKQSDVSDLETGPGSPID